MLLVNCAHQRLSGRDGVVNKEEDGLVSWKGNALSDDVDKLPHGLVMRAVANNLR